MTYSPKDLILGVDTHKEFHHAAVINHVGKSIADRKFDATSAGYSDLINWATGVGRIGRAGVEGTGSYGAGLTRELTRRGIPVIDVIAPDKQLRRLRGKTDQIDAYNAARAVLNELATAVPKAQDGFVEALRVLCTSRRVLRTSRRVLVKQRTESVNQLQGLIVRAHAELRVGLAKLKAKNLALRCSKLPVRQADDLVMTETKNVLRSLGKRYVELLTETDRLMKRLGEIVKEHASELLAVHGVGPDVAATMLIVAGENVDRLGSESAFAHLIGTAPIQASSGKTTRHRLNRGGHRQGNSAAYRIVMVRMKSHEKTRDYVVKALARGKTKREAMRLLKRYVAREIFQILITIRERHQQAPISA